MRIHLCKHLMLLVAVTVCNTVSRPASVCFAQSARIADVRRLAAAEGQEYRSLRDRLIKQRGAMWDLEAALNIDAGTGLAVFILNARITDPAIFAELDKIPLTRTRSGLPNFMSPVSEGASWQAFVIERAWKGLWPEKLSTAMIYSSLMMQDVVGPARLWETVDRSAMTHVLRAVAVYALCKTKGFKKRAAEILADNTSRPFVKRAILRGLQTYKPRFGHDLVVESVRHWRGDPPLRRMCLSFLGRAAAEESRAVLHRWLQDGRYPESMRLKILSNLIAFPRPGDAAALRRLMKRGGPSRKLRARVQQFWRKHGRLRCEHPRR